MTIVSGRAVPAVSNSTRFSRKPAPFAAFLLALWLALIAGVTATPAGAAEKSYTVTSADGVAIAVQEAGRADGQPIVFIHGLLGSHLNWEKQLQSAALSNYRLITFDLRGHGVSGKPESAEAYRDGRLWAGDLRAVLQGAKARKPILVGWSLGGAVITNYVAAYGDDDLGGLVYVGGVVELKPDLLQPQPKAYAGLASQDLKTHLDAVRDFLSLCFETQPDRRSFERLLANAATASWLMTRSVPSMTVSAADALPAIKVPVLMLYGEQDALVKAQASLARAKALNPAIRSTVYAKSGHAPFLEEADRFNEDLASFSKTVPLP
ncbi:alpha/beta fold hydrolase [Rhizobium sp. YIM 134829]|uniref:alpha/beta fold hydrolase n=1 Tax=Rhizobium sp. YIM 134829 TaxID=3390453 RepID=UPI0039782845